MKVMDSDEASRLAVQWGYEVDKNTLFKNGSDHFSFPLPAHREGMGYLAREIIKLLGSFDRCILLVTEHGIWPSSDDFNLFDRFRQSLGVTDKFPKRLVHIFEREETADLASYLHLMIIFSWGGFLFVDAPDEDKIAVFVSHDCWGRLAPGKNRSEDAEAFSKKWIEASQQ